MITCPALLVLLIPMLLLTTLLAFLKTTTKAELIRKTLFMLCILILITAMGWIEFMAGLILNAAGVFFKGEMNVSGGSTSSLIYASILFQGYSTGIIMGPWLFCAGTLGALSAIYKASAFRSLAFTVLGAELLIVGGGVIAMTCFPVLLSTISPIYFEVMLFPFYALFAVYLGSVMMQSVPLATYFWRGFHGTWPLLMLLILFLSLFSFAPHKKNIGNFAIPPASSSIIKILEKEIALHPNENFKGRVANIVPKLDWIAQAQYFSMLNRIARNDYQTTGLWLKHIPTLHEYSQSITPGFYRLYRRFLSDGTDHPYRSWSNFNKVNLKILRLLGVRFILSTEAQLHQLNWRDKLVFAPTLPALFLYELNHVNTSGISATTTKTFLHLPEVETFMAAKNFNLHEALLTKTININHFASAESSALTIVPSKGLRLQATSQGHTLLILPIEFSHCLEVHALSGALPTMMRVDLALTGILFNKFVDIMIDNRTGPFANPRCRWNDYREFAQLWRT
jgi:hypothetical protein